MVVGTFRIRVPDAAVAGGFTPDDAPILQHIIESLTENVKLNEDDGEVNRAYKMSEYTGKRHGQRGQNIDLERQNARRLRSKIMTWTLWPYARL
uniref:Uncharacterized protein n=1 Tax=Megaselia scalaris TaxID=36166 RepID=T1GB77_MEGSC